MRLSERFGRAADRLNRLGLTFGLPEAAVLSVVMIAVAVIGAWLES